MKYFLITGLVQTAPMGSKYGTNTVPFESENFPTRYEVDDFMRNKVEGYVSMTSIIEVSREESDTFFYAHRR